MAKRRVKGKPQQSKISQKNKGNGRHGKDRTAAAEHEACICGQKGVREYPPTTIHEGVPWCGRNACGLELQAGMDFNDECGNR